MAEAISPRERKRVDCRGPPAFMVEFQLSGKTAAIGSADQSY